MMEIARRMIRHHHHSLELMYFRFQNKHGIPTLRQSMATKLTHTARCALSPDAVDRALAAFRNPSTWPDWNRNAKGMVATEAESLSEGDLLAVHQIIKGALIESRWSVSKIREGENFCEITLTGEGQSRNERPIGRGLVDLEITATFLSEEDGGIEIHSVCSVSGFIKLFQGKLSEYLRSYSQNFLDDLAAIN